MNLPAHTAHRPCSARRAAVAALSFAAVTWSAPPTAAPPSQGVTQPAETPSPPAAREDPAAERAAATAILAELVRAARGAHEAPALAALVLRNGEVLTEIAEGVRCAECEASPVNVVTIDDLWHLGSCTKAITATLAGILVREGALTWDRTLSAAFPQWAESMRLEYRDVTLRDLLRMRGGVPGQGPQQAWAEAWAMAGSPTEQRRRYAEAVLRDGEPVTGHRYSNESYALVGLMCEEAAGAPYESLVISRIAEPLGITSLGFGPPGSVQDPCEPTQPCGHREDGSSVRPGPSADNPPAIAPAGRAHMTLRDWAKFIAVHLHGERDGAPALQLDAETLRALHDPGDDGDPPYAGGWLVRTHPRLGRTQATLWHNGSNTMWYVEAFLAPDHDLAVLVACNGGTPAARKAVNDVLRGALDRFAADPGARPTPPAEAPADAPSAPSTR